MAAAGGLRAEFARAAQHVANGANACARRADAGADAGGRGRREQVAQVARLVRQGRAGGRQKGRKQIGVGEASMIAA